MKDRAVLSITTQAPIKARFLALFDLATRQHGRQYKQSDFLVDMLDQHEQPAQQTPAPPEIAGPEIAGNSEQSALIAQQEEVIHQQNIKMLEMLAELERIRTESILITPGFPEIEHLKIVAASESERIGQQIDPAAVLLEMFTSYLKYGKHEHWPIPAELENLKEPYPLTESQ